MALKDFFILLIRSLNPGKYKDMKDYSLSNSVKYFLTLLFICMFFFLSAFLILEFPLSNSISNRIGKLEEFNVNLTIKADKPIVLLSFPKIVLDLTGNVSDIGSEYVIITNNDFIVKKFSPSIKDFRLFKEEKTDISSYSDVLANKEDVSSLITFFAILILPSIFFVLYVYFFARYLFIVGLFIIIGLIVLHFTKKGKFLPFQVLKTAIFSSTIMIVIDLLSKAFIDLFISSVILYGLFYSLCLYLGYDNKLTVSKKSEEKKAKKKDFEEYY